MDYAVVALLAAAVGAVELVARYRDAPGDALCRQPAILYIALNAVAGMIALHVVDSFGWTFGAPADAEGLTRISAAGLAAMTVLRSGLLTVRVGSSDVDVGPNWVLKIILGAADRAVDRARAHRRSTLVGDVMSDIDFEKAKAALPSYCLALMQNVTDEEQRDIGQVVASLEADEQLGMEAKTRRLALVLLNVVGEDVLRESVNALGDEIR
jgi:hypothetical protein